MAPDDVMDGRTECRMDGRTCGNCIPPPSVGDKKSGITICEGSAKYTGSNLHSTSSLVYILFHDHFDILHVLHAEVLL